MALLSSLTGFNLESWNTQHPGNAGGPWTIAEQMTQLTAGANGFPTNAPDATMQSTSAVAAIQLYGRIGSNPSAGTPVVVDPPDWVGDNQLWMDQPEDGLHNVPDAAEMGLQHIWGYYYAETNKTLDPYFGADRGGRLYFNPVAGSDVANVANLIADLDGEWTHPGAAPPAYPTAPISNWTQRAAQHGSPVTLQACRVYRWDAFIVADDVFDNWAYLFEFAEDDGTSINRINTFRELLDVEPDCAESVFTVAPAGPYSGGETLTVTFVARNADGDDIDIRDDLTITTDTGSISATSYDGNFTYTATITLPAQTAVAQTITLGIDHKYATDICTLPVVIPPSIDDEPDCDESTFTIAPAGPYTGGEVLAVTFVARNAAGDPITTRNDIVVTADGGATASATSYDGISTFTATVTLPAQTVTAQNIDIGIDHSTLTDICVETVTVQALIINDGVCVDVYLRPVGGVEIAGTRRRVCVTNGDTERPFEFTAGGLDPAVQYEVVQDNSTISGNGGTTTVGNVVSKVISEVC